MVSKMSKKKLRQIFAVKINILLLYFKFFFYNKFTEF